MAHDSSPATDDPRSELKFLSEALKAQLQWLKASGGQALAPIDPTLLEQRREIYRRLTVEVVQPQDPPAATEVAVSEVRSGQPEHVNAEPELVSEARRPLPPATSIPQATPVVTSQTPVAERATASLSLGGRVVPASDVDARPWHEHLMPRALTTDSSRKLELLQREVSQCTQCGLHEQRKNTVFSRGTPASGICFVGEGPGADEDAQGLPFVGKAGQLLDRMVEAIGFDRDDVYVCNIVKCRPPRNRKPEPHEMNTCSGYLTQQIDLIQPRVIVALGATAVQGLLGLAMGITRLRGQWRLYQGRIPVMPTFHPAYLLRQPSAKRQVWGDLKEVLSHLKVPPPERRR